MPLEVYRRGNGWWAKGYIEFNGTRITSYQRRSTGAFTEAGARAWCSAEEDREIRRHLIGDEAVLTFADALLLYPAKPQDAVYLIKVLPEIGHLPITGITPRGVKNLGPKLYPDASTDTWWRQVVTPVRAVINNAHEVGKGTPPIKIKAYSEKERIDQDQARGKSSRKETVPFSVEWVESFCAHADVYNATLVRFLFETAARIDQAISLTRADLDLMNKRVRIKAQKGHPEQWVTISHEMMIELANLPAKRPMNRKTGETLAPKVFGYADRGGYRKAWATICKKAGIQLLSAHSGRHGFYTELRVRQGVDPITAAKAGRWKNHALPDARYAHVETDQADIRARFRTNSVQGESDKSRNKLKTKR